MLAPPALRPSLPTDLSIPSPPPSFQKPSLLKRRTTLKRSIDDTDSMITPSSPSKKFRVTFDSNVEVFKPKNDIQSDPLVIREEVRRAVQRHLSGDDDAYEKIKSKFSTKYNSEGAPTTDDLRIYLQGILSNISILGRACGGLVHAVIFSEWIGRDEAYYSLFVKVLGNIASVQPAFIGKIAQMLVVLLGHQKTRRVPNSKPMRERLTHERTFQVLRYISQLVPNASGAIAEAVKKRMSWEFSKSLDRLTYVRNFLSLVDYIPEITSDILSTIMSELVKLDVSVQVTLDEAEDDAGEEAVAEYLDSAPVMSARHQLYPKQLGSPSFSDNESDSEDSDREVDPLTDQQELRFNGIVDTISQVDQIMEFLFQYYAKATTAPSLQARDDAISRLQDQFHNIILPTYKSRHAQFLILHFAQDSPIVVDQFVSSCIKVMFDKRQPARIRQSAGAYFSGFVGRGAKVSAVVVRDCIDLLCDQLNILRKLYEPGCGGPDIKRFNDFYAAFQAIIYIFCFRWQDLASVSSDMDYESDHDEAVEEYHFPDVLKSTLSAAICSPLNPLRVCTPLIVDKFAELTYAVRFLYIHSKIETNKHVRLQPSWRSLSDLHLSQPERDLSWVGDNGLLEGFFPYDPYYLPISKRWLESDYVEWKDMSGHGDDHGDSEDDEDLDNLMYVQPVVKEEDIQEEDMKEEDIKSEGIPV